MCGVVEGGITRGLLGYEAGQSGVGDIFAWFVEQQLPGRYRDEAARRGARPARVPLGARGRPGARRARARRARLAERQPLGARRPRAERRDRRAHARHEPEDIYRALIEATAFGARTIVETFDAAGVPVRELTVAGGLVKNPFLMQVYCRRAPAPAARGRVRRGAGARLGDPRRGRRRLPPRRPRRVGRDGASCVATRFLPDADAADRYDELYDHYTTLHDQFGRRSPMMHELRRPAGRRRPTGDRRSRPFAPSSPGCTPSSPRHGLVSWTSGNLSARVPGEELMVIKASGDPVRRADARDDGRLRPLRQRRRRRPRRLERRRHARLRLPPPPRRRRRRPHAQPVRDRVRRARRADPLRAHRDGRRVRRRDPGRAVRP